MVFSNPLLEDLVINVAQVKTIDVCFFLDMPEQLLHWKFGVLVDLSLQCWVCQTLPNILSETALRVPVWCVEVPGLEISDLQTPIDVCEHNFGLADGVPFAPKNDAIQPAAVLSPLNHLEPAPVWVLHEDPHLVNIVEHFLRNDSSY